MRIPCFRPTLDFGELDNDRSPEFKTGKPVSTRKYWRWKFSVDQALMTCFRGGQFLGFLLTSARSSVLKHERKMGHVQHWLMNDSKEPTDSNSLVSLEKDIAPTLYEVSRSFCIGSLSRLALMTRES